MVKLTLNLLLFRFFILFGKKNEIMGELTVFSNKYFQSIRPKADAFYKSRYLSVCLSVCHTFSLRFTVFLPPLPDVQCLNFLDIMNPWESNGKKWSQIWTYLLKNGLKSPRQKKFFTDFFHWFTPFKRLFAPTSRSPMSKLFIFSESLVK